MIDFIKADLTNQKEKLLINPLLDFEVPVNILTGEFIPLRDKKGQIIYDRDGKPLPQVSVALYKNLKFKHTSSGSLILSGSLHKYYNIITKQQNQNYDDFSFDNLTYVLNNLQAIFGIDLNSANLIRVEYGINIKFHISPKRFISERILELGGKTPTGTREVFHDEFGHKSIGYLKEFERSKYKIKIYDKGIQYGISDSILRFEINSYATYLDKITKSRMVLGDLFEKNILRNLGLHLIDQSSKLLIRDSISDAILEESEKTFIQAIRDPLVRTKMREEDRYKYYRALKKYITFCSNHEDYYIPDFIKQVESKVESLINPIKMSAQISSRIGELCAK